MRYFKQVDGIAIETKLAPTYATLLMRYLEDEILNSFVKKSLVLVALNWRYFYDLATCGRKLKKKLKMLNFCQPPIKFTAEYSLDKVNFLNVKVKQCGDNLLTEIYIKSTDTDHYLESSSCHIYHSKKYVPDNQDRRFNRISSEDKFFGNRCN